MTKFYLTLTALVIGPMLLAQVKVDDKKYSPSELVKDILVNSECARIENVRSATGTSVGHNGIGYFTKENSNFPLEAGVVLSTGKASRVPGPNPSDGNDTLNDGEGNQAVWKGDADLEQSIGLPTGNTHNATILEFDFIPTANLLSFNFLFASEEYNGSFQCQYSDAFAFLLRPAGSTGPYTNLAVVPNTNTPISVTKIHPQVNDASGSCAAINAQYFDRYNTGSNAAGSAINFNGQTKVFTAQSAVVPNQRYHIKLVIADERDGSLDSAVFLEAGSFNLGGNLGLDRTIAGGNPGCDGSPVILDGSIGTGATYQWTKNGTEITGATQATYAVTNNGDYSVKVSLSGTCNSTLGPVKIEFATPPSIALPPEDMVGCEMDSDGKEVFDLAINAQRILGNQDPSAFPISFHLSKEDAETNRNPIPQKYTNTQQTQQIFARIADKTQSCFKLAEFTIGVWKKPIAQAITDLERCDDGLDGDDTNGFATFDLNPVVAQALGSQSPADFEVRLYLDQAAADLAASGTELPMTFTNTANPQTLVARVSNKANPQCYALQSFSLKINPLPTVVARVSLTQCDDDTDGISNFNLNEANRLISRSHDEENFSYYVSEADALQKNAPIANPMVYANPTPLNSSVFVRVETAKGCFRTSRIDLVVSATQIPSGFRLAYEVCDDKHTDNDSTNGVAQFDFSNATAQIRGLFPAGQAIQIGYYQNQADALAERNAISDISAYRNTASPQSQEIFVRVDSDKVNACLGLGPHLRLVVKPLPEVRQLSDYALCSDTQTATFDLNTKLAEIKGDQTQDLLVSFHTSLAHAQTGTDPILGSYANTENPQRIYVRTQFDSNGNGQADATECFTTEMEFDLMVKANPVLAPTSLGNCSEQNASSYDLTQAATQLTQGAAGISLAYYASQADADAQRPIPDPTNFMTSALNTEVVVVGTSAKGCSAQTKLTLNTIRYLNLEKNLSPLEECETDNDGKDRFDLSRKENELLKDVPANLVSLAYYENESDAISGNGNYIPQPKAFSNTQAREQTIFIRITPKSNGCFQVVPLKLQVFGADTVQLDTKYLLCFDENERAQAPFVTLSTGLDPAQFDFEWFSKETKISGAGGPDLLVKAIGNYRVRVINKQNGCDISKTTEVYGSYAPRSLEVERSSRTFQGRNLLEARVTGKGEYEYQLDDGEFQASPIFDDVSLGWRSITVRDKHGCGKKTKKIMVLDYPKFFTPNGDGYNDTWQLEGAELLDRARIVIFDRYGQLIKEIASKEGHWDGTFRGRALPASDYWFKIFFRENGQDQMYKGHFSLKR